jgi:Helix-hairpin-helix motif
MIGTDKPNIALLGALFLFGGAALANAAGPTQRTSPASASVDTSAEDFKAVEAVCTRCHGVGLFMNKPRTWNRWNEVFTRMTARGAHPTEQQVDHIVRYFLANLTYVNINTSPADELSLAIGVSDAVANQIVARREKRKFRSLSELRSMPGVNAAVIEQRKSRIQF